MKRIRPVPGPTILILGLLLALPGVLLAQDTWMQNKLLELQGKQTSDFKLEDGATYTVNDQTYTAHFVNKDVIVLKRVPPKVQIGPHIAFQMDSEAGVEYAKSKGILPSIATGWGVGGTVNVGLMGGDGWEDTLGREAAMILAKATNTQTRFEYSINLMTRTIESWGYTAETFPGKIVLDVETWNMALLGRMPKPATGTGYEYSRTKGAVELRQPALHGNLTAEQWTKWWSVHPYAADSDKDGRNDVIRFTYKDVLRETIRITAKFRAAFPNASFGWYAFPLSNYWSDEAEAAEIAAAWSDSIGVLVQGKAMDFISPSVYDFYSHTYRFPGQTDESWTKEQAQAKARDEMRHGRAVLAALEMGDKYDVPVWLYTTHHYHSNGQCARSGHYVGDEWTQHVVYLGNLRSAAGRQIEGKILWGADRYYWRADPCYRPQLEAFSGETTDEGFKAWTEAYNRTHVDRALAAGAQIWKAPVSMTPDG